MPCNGAERRRARRADAKASGRLSQKTYKMRVFASLPFAKRYLLQRQQYMLLLFSFLFFSLFPPFFLPYLRQLRLVPVIPGGAVDPFLPFGQKRIDSVSNPRGPGPLGLPRCSETFNGGLLFGGRYVIIITIQKTDCILGKDVLICTKGNIHFSQTQNIKDHEKRGGTPP